LKCNASSPLGRRAFLQLSGLAAVSSCLPLWAFAAYAPPTHRLHIRNAEVELAPGRRITTNTYNGQLPGPLLRATVGQQVAVDVYNETDQSEQIHWQGQRLADPATAVIPARSRRRMEFIPQRPGLFVYHSLAVAGTDLSAGLYSGQAGALLVDARDHGPVVSQVVVLKGYEPFMQRTARGIDVGYGALTVNGRIPGGGAALRARVGEQVLLHVLNADAMESYRLELPGHVFAFERTARAVDGLELSPGECVSAWVVVNGTADWALRAADPTSVRPESVPGDSAETFELVLTRLQAARSGFNRWAVNGTSFSLGDARPVTQLRRGGRYRLRIHNTSDEIVPLHLQGHRLLTAGTVKDVTVIGARQQAEVDFVADSPGRTLLHSTRQLQSDFGLAALFDYA
jgi:FtsP/CotA-like multicopper oxidase with cupredoxin domain